MMSSWIEQIVQHMIQSLLTRILEKQAKKSSEKMQTKAEDELDTLSSEQVYFFGFETYLRFLIAFLLSLLVSAFLLVLRSFLSLSLIQNAVFIGISLLLGVLTLYFYRHAGVAVYASGGLYLSYKSGNVIDVSWHDVKRMRLSAMSLHIYTEHGKIKLPQTPMLCKLIDFVDSQYPSFTKEVLQSRFYRQLKAQIK